MEKENKENTSVEEEQTNAEESKDTQSETPKKSELEIAKDRAAELNDKYLRLYAEYDNFRKRSNREKDARYGDAVIDAVAAILPIGDNLERALAAEVTSDDAKKLKEGVEMVMKQFNDTLEKLNVKPIKALGEQFDPNLHNAVMHIEDDSVDENTVVEEFMRGYEYKDGRVVRYSMVKVAN